jgi:hypothetical protein
LATGTRAGIIESYPFAEKINGLEPEAEGSIIEEDHRFYPMAASYFSLEHQGGDLVFTISEETEGVFFSLHPVSDGMVDHPIEQWDGVGPSSLIWEDSSSGEYWLVGTYPENADQSEKFEFCLGADCIPLLDETSQQEPSDTIKEESPNCGGCSTSSNGVFWPVFLLIYPFIRRESPSAIA